MRILVVDDDDSTRLVLGRLLRGEGWTVDACDDGVKGLELVHAAAYDVLLTDLVMPEMSGIELVVAARAIHPALRCLIMSGFSAPDVDPSGAEWLTKPLDFDALVALIKG